VSCEFDDDNDYGGDNDSGSGRGDVDTDDAAAAGIDVAVFILCDAESVTPFPSLEEDSSSIAEAMEPHRASVADVTIDISSSS
jgi:hypothetical protein